VNRAVAALELGNPLSICSVTESALLWQSFGYDSNYYSEIVFLILRVKFHFVSS
jgi:hypothetical protein